MSSKTGLSEQCEKAIDSEGNLNGEERTELNFVTQVQKATL